MAFQEVIEFSSRPEEAQRAVLGIWVIPIAPNGKVLVMENQIPKFVSQKVPGQLNCPVETYQPEDGKHFRSTIERAIYEEIGSLEYDPETVQPIGTVRLVGLDRKVFAVPYLVQVPNETSMIYNPSDPNESRNPHWVSLEEIDYTRRLNIGPYEVPLFRTPMVEIAELVCRALNGEKMKVLTTKAPVIKQEVYDFLETNSSANSLAQQSIPQIRP